MHFHDFGFLVDITPKVNDRTFLKYFMWVALGQRKKSLHFGKDLDHILEVKKS